ncbi:GGDEF domain-containing protein [Demequina muriae]|uniref:Diguanylate cyclase n=1 Tax=Demequina muriae TaxID=3051664 RepID=A0ABT8GIH0_9MICO|nr:diguanylate cyclase [Demequina sp. EGI L300058]MDN4481179.1 diguanylate cyclase [Demequina sp. EGI L300058]
MLDDETMRIALGAVSLVVLLLFYLGVYRPTRSSFSGWWTLSLLSAGTSSTLLLFNRGELELVVNSGSMALAAVGATCVWFATRALRRERLPRWILGVAPVAILVSAVGYEPVGDTWVDHGALSLYMAVMFVATAVEMWMAWKARRAMAQHALNREALVALLVIAIAGSALAAFYVLRTVMNVVFGPASDAFQMVVGSSAEDALLLVFLVAVTFSVSAIGWDEQAHDLRSRAMHDDLTGLLGRTEFRAQAKGALSGTESSGERALLVVADLDHFKDINDTHGHAAGDRALMAFAAVLTDHLRPGERAGRLGGEEFGLVLLDVDDAEALVRLRAISDDFAARTSTFDFPLPTVSYGFAGPHDGVPGDQVFEEADLAMYEAKAQGRDRAVRYTEQIGRRPSNLFRRRHGDQEDAVEPL